MSSEAHPPLQAVCAGAGVGSVSVSGNGNNLPSFPTQLTWGHALSEVHSSVLRADSPHLWTPATFRKPQHDCITCKHAVIKPCSSPHKIPSSYTEDTLNHLVVLSYVDHDHFSNHADPAGATRVMRIHATPEPHLVKQERRVRGILKTSQV